jgi:hypothetical protein
MTGQLAQLIALTAYGNQWLRTSRLPAGFYPTNSVFQHCNRVDFRQVDGKNELLIAIDPNFWFQYLQHFGCRMLRLYYESSKETLPAKEHQLAGMIGGGGVWLIEAIFADHSDFWSGRWQVTRKEDPDDRIWWVNYLRSQVNLATVDLQFDLAATAAELHAALEGVVAFALRKDLGDWGEFFQKALARLNSDAPAAGFYNEALIPVGELSIGEFSLQARQVFFAAGSAWAFGGMGSWNDMYFEKSEDNEQYGAVSARLYDAINRAIVASVNWLHPGTVI